MNALYYLQKKMFNRIENLSALLVLITAMRLVCSSPLNQEQLDNLSNTMSIKVRNLYNLRDNAKTHTVRLYIKNNGSDVIPPTGWRLYFHSMFLLYPEVFPKNMTVNLKLEHIRVGMVQGDLYYLEPSKGFVEIPPDGERQYDIKAQYWMISRTDFMPRWYAVSENANIEPRVVKSTESLDLEYVEPFDDVRQWKRFASDRYNPFTAQARFRRYQTSDKRKVEKIVIPTPRHVEINEEITIDEVDGTWRIYVAESRYNKTGRYLSDVLKIKIEPNLPSKHVIIIDKTDNPSSAESYSLKIDAANHKIYLKSKEEKGIFYAANSLWSIIDGYKRRNIPDITITDEPRYHFRGMHVDVARNFHNLSVMKRIISAMAMYKMNKIHLHLSDDEGWRLEIPGLPELTEVGGQRCHDYNNRKCIIPQLGSGPFNTSSGSGYFSTEDYKELLRFANDRHIEVIPEFDMPGHAHAAIFSMEERYRRYHEAGNEEEAFKYRLIDPDDKSEYISVQQWFDNAVNPCVHSLYTFIRKVMDEVIALHKDIQPLNMYHFGGDESGHFSGEKSPLCKKFINDNPEYNVTKGINIYFVEKVAELAAERNISLCGWGDWFANGNHNHIKSTDLKTGTNYAIPWNSIWERGDGSQAYKLANAGFKVILAPATNIYFDHPQEPDPEERGLYWATRFIDTQKVLKFMPDLLYDNIFEEGNGKKITKADVCGQNSEKCEVLEKKENIIGMEGAMFSETIRTSEDVDYMTFPRIVALAERAWHKASFEDDSIPLEEREDRFYHEWESFANTLGYKELQRLDNAGIKYRVPPPGARVSKDGEVELSTGFPGLETQVSYNKGITWSNISYENTFKWRNDDIEGSSIHLRTVSANGMRYSRVVELFRDEPLDWSDQLTIDYMADNLEVHMEVISNFERTDDDYVPILLELHNSGDTDIPRATWKLYFYSLYGAKVESLSCGLRLIHEIGSLYYFTPESTGFSVIAAGETLTCRYHNRHWMVERFNNMPNWFVTSLGMTAKVVKSTESENIDYVGNFDRPDKWKRTKNDQYDPYTPETRYDLYRSSKNRKQSSYKIVPTPFKTSLVNDVLSFTSLDWKIMKSADFPFEVDYLAENLNLSVVTSGQSKIISFVKKIPSENEPEAYDLNINATTKTIMITANSSAGAFYGVQSLISLVEGNTGDLIQTNIQDKPRGVMVDTARNFKKKQWILNLIDVMSLYKLNKLHFHLTDDEGWRLEIPSIPELTQLGSKRCYSDYIGVCTMPQYGSGPNINTHGSGFYTVNDYRDILSYANKRHIEVIPEIETPGHATAAIVSMEYRESHIMKLKNHGNKILPESYLLSNNFDSAVSSPLKWPRNAIDPCLNTTYIFVETVIDSLIEMHRDIQPLKVIHLGGDEVPEGVWNDSKACLSMLEPGGQINTKQLKRLFLKRVADIVASKGLTLASWDDGIYADDKPNPISDYKSEVHVYTWDSRSSNIKRVSEFANEGYKVVLPLASHLYFDHPQEPDPEERGPQWATRYTDTEKVFGFMPDDIYANFNVDRFGNKIDLKEMCENEACLMMNKTKNILGLQACIFSETIRTKEQFHAMVFPRLLALAERAWHKASWEVSTDVNERNIKRMEDWENFSDNLGYKELSRLDRRETNYRISPPGARIDDGILKVNTKYANLLVECSKDNGKTWIIYEEAKVHPGTKILLRSRSKTSNVSSRHIEVSMATVSNAADVDSHISLFVFLVYFICIVLAQ